MKKIIVLICFVSLFGLFGCDDPRLNEELKMDGIRKQAAISIPIPSVSYFQEKRTIAKWAERWDKPNVVTYVYLFNFGNCIGYYVCLGKPASTRSYIVPEDEIKCGSVVVSAPDIDGTYGENNPGIRFFTAEGTAVEWAGSGASYLYSDVPLPLGVPKLNKVIAK